MKVFKNKKQRIVAVFLSLVFAFMLVPYMDVYANTYSFIEIYDHHTDDRKDCETPITVTCDDDVYIFRIMYSDGTGTYLVASKCPFEWQGTEIGNIYYYGTKGNNSYQGMGTTPENGVNVSFFYSDLGGYYPDNAGTYYYSNYIVVPYDSNEDYKSKLLRFFDTGDDTGFDYSNAISEGGIEKPIYDDDIGTLIISKSKMYEESNGEDVNDLYNLFSWKMKTNTGFSLSDNKYARTFIQVRVESKCVVYDDRRHTKLHKKFDNYGEKAMLINSHPVDSQPLKISYLTDIPNVLPKTHAEIHNPVFTGYNYTLYFRVVCTDDLAVIPSDTSEWHCGGWRALDCNADILVGQSDTTENGRFDDEDNWVTDEDDGNNSIESGSDSVHDTDDAKDDFNNSSSAVDSSVNGAISTMQSLLDMIRHVPQIISTIFSFLPNWCLNIVGLAFVALVVLIIYKLVRG